MGSINLCDVRVVIMYFVFSISSYVEETYFNFGDGDKGCMDRFKFVCRKGYFCINFKTSSVLKDSGLVLIKELTISLILFFVVSHDGLSVEIVLKNI